MTKLFWHDKATILEKIFQGFFIVIAALLLLQWLLERYLHLSNFQLTMINWFVWFFLFLESAVLVTLAKDKTRYLIKNWLNIVVLIAFFPLLWFHTTAIVFLRFARFLILLRLFVPSYKAIKEVITFNQIGICLLLLVVLAILSGILMSNIDPAIPTLGDGVWWAWETITSVGYGDEAPTSLHGRILAVFVMLFGLCIFSIITANLSAYFIGKSKLSKDAQAGKLEGKEILRLMHDMQKQLDEIKQKVDSK